MEILKKIKELEETLNTDSSNSSKAPSQDPFGPCKPKKPTGRRQGVQKERPGHSQGLPPASQVQVLRD